MLCLFQALERQKKTAATMKHMYLPNPLDRLLAFLERGETQLVTLTC